MKTLFAILFLLFTSNTFADDRASSVVWNKTDQVLFGTYAALSGIDVLQTERALDKGYREANPVFGSNPSTQRLVISKLVVLGVVYILAENFPEQRRPILVVSNVIQGAVVLHNSKYVTIGESLKRD